MSMNLIVPIELIAGECQSNTSDITFNVSKSGLNDSDYDGATYYFEVVGTNSDSVDRSVYLINGASTTVATATIPASTTTNLRVRSTSFTPTSGADEYRIKIQGTTSNYQLKAFGARLIIVQVNATKTKIQISFSRDTWNTNNFSDVARLTGQNTTTYAESVEYSRWKKVTTEMATIDSWEFEAVFANPSTTGYARLWNATDNAQIAELSGANATLTRYTASVADNATNFHENDLIGFQGKSGSAGVNTAFAKLALYVKLTSITKAEIHLSTGGLLPSGETSSAGTMDEEVFKYEASGYSYPATYFEAEGTWNENADKLFLRDLGTADGGESGSSVSGSGLNFNSASRIFRRSGALTLTANNRYCTYFAAGTSTKIIHTSYIIVFAYETPPATPANSERSAKTTGKSTSNSERSAKTTGKTTANSSRSAKTTGVAGDLFSRETKAALPSTVANLEPIYNATDVTNVATDNDVFVDLDVTISGYAIHQYKKLNSNNTDKIDITWKGKSSVATSSQAVRLQIYNHTSGLWETLDTESSAGVAVEFTLTGSVTTSLANYYDANNIITIRVYQQVT